MLPRLRQRALLEAISKFDDADLATVAGRERIVQKMALSIADFERRMLPAGAPRMSLRRLEAVVRVAMSNMVAACA